MADNEILRRRFLAHVGQTSPSPMMIPVERAEGVFFHTPEGKPYYCLLYTSPSPRDRTRSRMPSSA